MVHRPDRFPSATLPGAAAGPEVELAGAVVSCVEQPIAQSASKHRQVSKRSAPLGLVGAKDFILFRLEVRAPDSSELRCDLRGRRTHTRSCTRVTAALVRSVGSCPWDESRRHRWNVTGWLLGDPLFADGDVAFFNFFLLHDLDVSPGLQLLVMNARALRREIEVGRSVLGRRIGRDSGSSVIFGDTGGAACDHQHQGCGQCQSSLVFQGYSPSSLTRFVHCASTQAYRGGCLIPSRSILLRSVFGCSPRISAAPLRPEIRHPVTSRVSRM